MFHLPKERGTDASIAALLGALIGAAAGVVSQVFTARYTDRTERRKLAVEAGLREWEHMLKMVHERGGGSLFPPILFVHFNHEFLRLIEGGSVTSADYEGLVKKSDQLKAAIQAAQPRRDKR